jgi:hypothetical protein
LSHLDFQHIVCSSVLISPVGALCETVLCHTHVYVEENYTSFHRKWSENSISDGFLFQSMSIVNHGRKNRFNDLCFLFLVSHVFRDSSSAWESWVAMCVSIETYVGPNLLQNTDFSSISQVTKLHSFKLTILQIFDRFFSLTSWIFQDPDLEISRFKGTKVVRFLVF